MQDRHYHVSSGVGMNISNITLLAKGMSKKKKNFIS